MVEVSALVIGLWPEILTHKSYFDFIKITVQVWTVGWFFTSKE